MNLSDGSQVGYTEGRHSRSLRYRSKELLGAN